MAQVPVAALFGAALSILAVGAVLAFPSALPWVGGGLAIGVAFGLLLSGFWSCAVLMLVISMGCATHRGYANGRLAANGPSDSRHFDLNTLASQAMLVLPIVIGGTRGVVNGNMFIGLAYAIPLLGIALACWPMSDFATKQFARELSPPKKRPNRKAERG